MGVNAGSAAAARDCRLGRSVSPIGPEREAV